MIPLKCTPNWDDLGWGGIPREGRGEEIAGIADIARDRRDRKTNPGVESAKSLFFGVELGEGGYHRDRIIGEIGNRDPQPRAAVPHDGRKRKVARKRNELASPSYEIVWIVRSAPAGILSPDQLLSGP